MKQETEWIEWFCFFLLIPSYSGGSRGGTRGGGWRPHYCWTKLRPKGSKKKIFKTARPTYVSGSGWLPSPPPPPYLKVWIRHWVNQANWRVGFFVVILSGFCRLLLNRELKQRRRQQRIQQKVLDLDQKNEQRCTCCHTLLYISRPKLQSTTWNFLISRFMEDGNARRFCFSFNELR